MIHQIKLLKYFSIIPQRANRFFTLSFRINSDIPLSETLDQQQKAHISKFQEAGAILIALKHVKKVNENQNIKQKQPPTNTIFFQSPNEVQPYNFIKQSPLFKQNLIQKYWIDEIEMEPKVRDKQIAPDFLRQ